MDLALRLLIFISAAFIPCIVALINSTDRKRSRIQWILGSVVILTTIAYNAFYLYPSRFRIDVSLPIQVCDLLGFAAIFALTVSWRLARVAIVLCSIPFVLQAVVTPVGEQELTSPRTILYWTFHVCIFAAFLFEVTVRRFKPTLRDFSLICLIDLGYVIIIVSLDFFSGWNYGYIGNAKPGETTLVDFLGPWPFRVLTMTLLAVLLQALCYLLFRNWRKIT